MYEQYRPQRFQILPPVVKNLLILNGLFFLATLLLARQEIYLTDILGLHYFEADKFKPYQFISYMFLHDPSSIWHIAMNMFALWMFGSVMENYWGSKRFLVFYLFCGIGAALSHYVIYYFEISPVLSRIDNYLSDPDPRQLTAFFGTIDGIRMDVVKEAAARMIQVANDGHVAEARSMALELVNQFRTNFLNEPTVIGASGAVFGILLAYGISFPNTLLYVFFTLPVKAKYFVFFYGMTELISGVIDKPGDNVAHFAHLGGMLFGFLLIMYWRGNRNRY